MIVRDVLYFGGLFDAEVLAGEEGLTQELESVTTIEVTDSELAEWIMENQLYISALYSIADDVDKQMHLIRLLKEHKACGLVLCHAGHWIKKVDEKLIRLCDELRFPLIKANPETSYMDILYPILNVTVGGEARESRPIYSLQDEILNLLEGGDIKKTFSQLAELQEVYVTYLDPYCNCLFSDMDPETIELQRKRVLDNFGDYFMRLQKEKHLVLDAGDETISLIRAKNTTFGFLILKPRKRQRREKIIESADALGTIFSLIYGRSAMTLHLRDYYTGEFLKDLLVWNFKNTEQAIKRGLNVGVDIRDKDILCVINLNSYHEGEAPEWEKKQDIIKKEAFPFLKKQCSLIDGTFILHMSSDQILLILHTAGRYEEVLLCMKKIICFMKEKMVSVSIGISNHFSEPAMIPEAYRQSNMAYSLGREYLGPGKAVVYRDVRFVAGVMEQKNTTEMQGFAEQTLLPLKQYDLNHGTELVRTLEAMLCCNCNVSNAARKLFMHRNTVTNHCEKIKEILGFSPFELPYSIHFFFAIQLLK